MRYILSSLGFLLILSGCSGNGNPVVAVTDTIQNDSVKVSFSVADSSLGIHDTLVATTTVYNLTNHTIIFYQGYCSFTWSLQNDSGRSIMGYKCNPYVRPQYLITWSIPPHQSEVFSTYGIHSAISDQSGAPVLPGSYQLTATCDPFGAFSLKLHLH